MSTRTCLYIVRFLMLIGALVWATRLAAAGPDPCRSPAVFFALQSEGSSTRNHDEYRHVIIDELPDRRSIDQQDSTGRNRRRYR